MSDTYYRDAYYRLDAEIDRLRAELADAEADIADMRVSYHPGQFCPNIRGQVERLEAEIDRLRAELAGFKAELTHIEAVNDDLEEIIARVRELCDNTPDLVGFHVPLPGSVSVAAVLAALEGNQP